MPTTAALVHIHQGTRKMNNFFASVNFCLQSKLKMCVECLMRLIFLHFDDTLQYWFLGNWNGVEIAESHNNLHNYGIEKDFQESLSRVNIVEYAKLRCADFCEWLLDDKKITKILE